MRYSAWVYILTNRWRTVLYVGITNDIRTRTWEHRMKQDPKAFTARYNLVILVYYEEFESIVDAIAREKYIKKRSRAWKNALISKMNPEWRDLTADVEKFR